MAEMEKLNQRIKNCKNDAEAISLQQLLTSQLVEKFSNPHIQEEIAKKIKVNEH